MQSKAATIDEYLANVPEDRREAISAVRDVVLENLPDGYEEVINWGMITYQIPLETYSDTYNGKPFLYAAVASQKNHMAVYLTGIYTSEKLRREFETAYKATGKRFDVGQSCVRFRKLEDLPLALIGKTIASFGVEELVNHVKKIEAERKSEKRRTRKRTSGNKR